MLDRLPELVIKEVKGLFDEIHVDAMGCLHGIRHPRPAKKSTASSGEDGQWANGCAIPLPGSGAIPCTRSSLESISVNQE